jgi:hypothetical protein
MGEELTFFIYIYIYGNDIESLWCSDWVTLYKYKYIHSLFEFYNMIIMQYEEKHGKHGSKSLVEN